jgi:hypothetical protein
MLIKVVNQREVHPKRSGNAFPYGRQDIETIPKATWREVFCRFTIEVASPGGLSEETKLEKLARASPNNAVSQAEELIFDKVQASSAPPYNVEY